MGLKFIINRPGVAGAIHQTPSALVNYFSKSAFVEISSKHLHSQFVRAKELKFLENVHRTMYHMSHVMCHVSWVMGHMSHLTSHMSHVTCYVSTI